MLDEEKCAEVDKLELDDGRRVFCSRVVREAGNPAWTPKVGDKEEDSNKF